MNRFVAFLLLVLSASAFAQGPQIKSGSTLYIEPMGGYETYLAAAFAKKNVPLVMVADKEKAEYVITSTAVHRDLSDRGSSVVVNNNVGTSDTPASRIQASMQQGYAAGAAERRALGETTVSIAVIDPHSSQIVFAYSAGKMGTKQLQKTAEDCAKHLKEYVEKKQK